MTTSEPSLNVICSLAIESMGRFWVPYSLAPCSLNCDIVRETSLLSYYNDADFRDFEFHIL